MACVKLTDEIKQFASQFKGEDPKAVSNLLGLWWEANPQRSDSLPSKEEFEFFADSIRNQSITGTTVPYNLPRQEAQTYTVRGSHIFNSKGKEVFKDDGKHRNRIFANLAVKQKRAVVVEYRGSKYVVNNKGAIISVATGNIMNWGEENGDRKAIVSIAKNKFSVMTPVTTSSNTPRLSFQMYFPYGSQKRAGVTADTTLEAVKRGERTATTRYIKHGHIDQWKKAKVGDIVEFHNKEGESILVRITKELHQLPKSTTAEEWSKKEGWSVLRFEQNVRPEIEKGEAYQIEFEYVGSSKDTSNRPTLISPTIESYNGNWTREEVAKDTESLYIFTDNTDRDSGSGTIDPKSRYSQKYGEGKHFPTMTQAVLRGLDNAMPLSTQRWYHGKVKGVFGRWNDADFEEFKKVIDAEIEDIVKEWKSGKYKRIVIAGTDSFFNSKISNISMERTPRLYQYLRYKLEQIGIKSGESANTVLDNALLSSVESSSKEDNLSEEERDDYLASLSNALPPSETPSEGTTEEHIFDKMTVPKSSVSEIATVDKEFDPRVRRDRVVLLARLFSNQIDTSLEEKKKFIREKMMDKDTTDTERDQLREELYSLDRRKIINLLTPAGIYREVYNTFKKYVQDTDEGRVQTELDKINKDEQDLIDRGEIEESDRFSEEEKLASAKEKAVYKKQEYEKLLRHFKPLVEEASSILLRTEGIRVDPTYATTKEGNLTKDNPDGQSNTEAQDPFENEYETFKDGWMSEFREVSSYERLSQAVRAILKDIPRLARDEAGYYIEEDDLGNTRYLDADSAHATLIDKLRFMISSDDMIPLLEDLMKTKPWVELIIDRLKKDDSLFSQFYQDFRKDFQSYWIQKRIVNPDGSSTIQTIQINKPEGIEYLIDSWRDNYESGSILDSDSVYRANGEINRDNARKGIDLTNALFKDISRLDSQGKIDFIEKEENYKRLVKLLNMVGIVPNDSVLKVALSDIKSVPGITFEDPLNRVLSSLRVIFDGLGKKGLVKTETKEGTGVEDLINVFEGAYTDIASMLSEVVDDAIESSTRENGKSYYAHVNPCYLGKLIKQLKNVRNNTDEFKAFIQREFGQYSWFWNAKEGKWLSDWVEKLDSNPAMRELLDHKVVLNYDKKEYNQWDDLDYTRVLLSEFFAIPDGNAAWYYVPILSDAPSAEFIKFVRYRTGSEKTKEGEPRTFQDIILDKMADTVTQEYNRIMTVIERDERRLKGEKISPIDNYDIPRDKEGNIKKDANGNEIKGGSEFKFYPQLNNLRYINEKTGKEETFLQRLSRLREGSPSEFREFIRETLRDIMEEGFEQEYEKWTNMGLFEELPNGRLKYSIGQYQIGQSEQNSKVAEALQRAADILGDSFTTNMNILLYKYKTNRPIRDKQAQEVFKEIEELLNNKVERGEIEAKDRDSIVRNLTTKNNLKRALEEYYWNSKFATSQIIELTTTDLAFYKNLEDFQKRFKEVHAPSLRLNTKATFHGKPIGREWERTIYLKDNIIVSTTIKDIEEILNAKVKKHELTTIERDHILSQFKKINVADAQAYRSLSSYRAILGMSGQWTDEMETAYEHLTSPDGGWNMQDFNTIWQTKKPFVYTQIANESGTDYGAIKTPVQHKNSEFLLLALYNAVGGNLHKSDKLRAINDFMEKNNIDVVQFESAVKVGGQEKIDLNSTTGYDDTLAVLREKTGIASGTEDPNVIHKVSYEDYGIQTPTPEHGIDAFQLIGTQIRKLITADIDDNAIITVGNKSLTKKQWLDLYHRVNTENILQAFRSVHSRFSDIHEIEQVIQDEIRGSSKYDYEMMKACTVDKETGQFNIPLFDPIQSIRIQTLLNSIIKKQVTKQQIKGGALIQVSAYGLTDKLKIVYEGEGENKRPKYLECYMPAYSRAFYEPLMDKNGLLDVNKLPDDLRKLIGLRIPTEDKYSMVPLYIKGFLPQQNGSAIMLPAEITTLSGSD